jgi:murein DD-endopeptidase MepM/ murein hydrolase activator NlpD
MSAGKVTIALVMLAAAGGIFIYSSDEKINASPESNSEANSDLQVPVSLQTLYDIPIKNYELSIRKIKKGQFLGDITGSHGIDQRDLIEMENSYKDVFDERRIKSGNPYTLFFPKGFRQRLSYFVYEINEVDYVVYDFERKRIYTGAKKVSFQRKTATGVIKSSLFGTLDERHLRAGLGHELSDIFGWVVDFYHLQEGDKFKVVYEEKVIDGQPSKVHRVLSALFTHGGNDFYAFHFQPKELQAGNYFDESGNSLRREFLKAPLKFSRISSKYSGRRFHPVLKQYRPHLGVDYAAPTGTPILAVGDGMVVEAQYNINNGNYVKIRHNSTYSTQYLHMSKFAGGIRHGAKVSQGDVIGYVGSTGLATGPHVCFRFWKNGSQVDPLKVQIPPSKPVEATYRQDYDKLTASLKQELDGLSYTE